MNIHLKYISAEQRLIDLFAKSYPVASNYPDAEFVNLVAKVVR